MSGQAIQTDIPARLDRLPWSRFHILVIVALGVTWILDGLEVTIVGSLGPVLQDKRTLGLTVQDVGTVASVYVVGAVTGALFFGWLTDRVGRKLIFNVTLGIYVTGVLLSAFAWDFWSFAAFRFITGLGIGGEYAAINSAIDELIPARIRGRIDLMVNGSYWGGAALGAAVRRGGAAGLGLAAGLRHWRGARHLHPVPSPPGAREPPLAGDPRAGASGQDQYPRHRAARGA